MFDREYRQRIAEMHGFRTPADMCGGVFERPCATLQSVDSAINDLLVVRAPIGVSHGLIKHQLAYRWLERPRGFIARLVWAWRHLFGD
jgi:hypothetical protein